MIQKSHSLIVLLLSGLVILLGLQTSIAANNEAVGHALAAIMKQGGIDTGSEQANANLIDIKAFYATRSFKPVWSRDAGPKGKAKALLGELQTSKVHGLSANFYHIDEIKRLMKSRKPEDLARLDVLLTGALVDFVHDLINGRTTNLGTVPYNRVKPVKIDAAGLIEKAAAAGNLRLMLGRIVGKDRRYLRLVAKMLEFERIDAAGRWPSNIASGKPSAVRQLLLLTGDLPIKHAKGGNRLDAPLRAAIRAYQDRHGLQVDGALGPNTLKAMSISPKARIEQIKVNLERRRWQNRLVGEDLIYYNLIDRQIKVLSKNKTIGELNVSPQTSSSPLPVFYGDILEIKRVGEGSSQKFSLHFISNTNGSEQFSGTVDIDASDAILRKSILPLLGAGDAEEFESWTSTQPSLKLKNPIPLYVTYLTAWATRNGNVHFRNDNLQRDGMVLLPQ